MTAITYRIPAEIKHFSPGQTRTYVTLGEFENSFEIADIGEPQLVLASTNRFTKRETRYFWDGERFFVHLGSLNEAASITVPQSDTRSAAIRQGYRHVKRFDGRFTPPGSARAFMKETPHILDQNYYRMDSDLDVMNDRRSAEAYLSRVCLHEGQLYKLVPEPSLVVHQIAEMDGEAGEVAVCLLGDDHMWNLKRPVRAVFGVNAIDDALQAAAVLAGETDTEVAPMPERLDIVDFTAFSTEAPEVCLGLALEYMRKAVVEHFRSPRNIQGRNAPMSSDAVAAYNALIRVPEGPLLTADAVRRAEDILQACFSSRELRDLPDSGVEMWEHWEARSIVVNYAASHCPFP